MRFLLPLLAVLASCGSTGKTADDGFVPLFNGKDLSGWVNMNTAPGTWSVRNDVIVCTGKPTGLLRSDKQYENYVLELEWKHLKQTGNAGLFVHSAGITAPGTPFAKAIEVQVMLMDKPHPEGLYTGQGDIFSIHGATLTPDRAHPKGWERCLPSEERTKPAGEWNHYRVVSQDGVVELHVNGKKVSGATMCNPRKGYVCLESEGSEVHFRNIRIQERPASHPPVSEVAETARGFVPIYTGVDLSGWKADPANEGHWKAKDWTLDYDGKGADLWSVKEYKDFTLIADWRFPRKPVEADRPKILPDGSEQGTEKTQDAGDSGIYLRGSSKSQVNLWCWPVGSGEVYGYRTDKAQSPEVRAGVTPKLRADRPPGQWNRVEITMKGDRLTVVMNGKTVIENAQLPGIPASGPIALQHHGDPVQFASLLIKELD